VRDGTVREAAQRNLGGHVGILNWMAWNSAMAPNGGAH
jgi:hypothetical protein